MTERHNKSNYQTLRRLLQYAKPYRIYFLAAIVLSLILAPLTPILPYLINRMVDDYIILKDAVGLLRMSVIYIAILVITVFLKYAFTIVANTLGQNIVYDLRTQVYNHLMSLRIRYFDKTAVGTSTTRTVNDIETVNAIFTQGLITMIADILGIMAILVVMLYTSVKLTLVCLSVLPFLILASYVFKEKVKAAFQKVRTQISEMNSFLQEHITGIRVVQLFNVQDLARSRFKSINRAYTQANIDNIFYYAVFFPVVELVSATALAILVWWGTRGVFENTVTMGQLVAFPMYIFRLFRPVRMIADKFNTLQMGLVACDRVFNVLDVMDKVEHQGYLKSDNLTGKVEFHKVHFSYEQGQEVLSDINFTLEAGESLAVVGPTGSGKTSLISLLSRLYPFEKGDILLDGTSIYDFELAALRKKIGVVLQDVFLFNGSIRDNIRLLDDEVDDTKINKAIKLISAENMIAGLDGGLDYQLTERGANLSMGQRQLIAFLRVLVYEPVLFILDEATSSVDPLTESFIQSAVETLIQRSSCIIIAHRLSTIKHVDKILYLENGIIKELGPHETLLEKEDGHFRKMYMEQWAQAAVESA